MPSLLGNLDDTDLVRQVYELEKLLPANVYRQLENSVFGLNGSRRNLSLYRNRLISKCTLSAASRWAGSPDCPFL